MADKINRLVDGSPEQKTLIADQDDFDVPDADHANERWIPGLIVGGLPAIGTADIDTSLPDTSYINLADGNAGPVTAMYAVRRREVIDTRHYAVKTDMPSSGGGPVNADTQMGIMVSRGAAYDPNNVVSLFHRNDDVAPFLGLEARATVAGVPQAPVQVPLLTGTIALMIVRTGHIFELWYSSAFLAPNERWTKMAQYEDPTDAFGSDTSYYEFAYGSKAGAFPPDTFNVTVAFQKFRLLFLGGALADLISGGARQYGVRALHEWFGNDALDAPLNTIYRFPYAYKPGEAVLFWHRNGVLQDLTGGIYAETNARTVTMAAGVDDQDRVLGLSVAANIGKGGLVGTPDRPPAGAGQGPYTVTGAFTDEEELYVYRNGVLQLEGVGNNYVADVPNNQFTFEAGTVILPADVIVSAVIKRGEQGQQWRERQVTGAFPGVIAVVNDMDREHDCILLYLNGVLLSESFEYDVTGVNAIQVYAAAGAPNDVEIVAIRYSQNPEWRL